MIASILALVLGTIPWCGAYMWINEGPNNFTVNQGGTASFECEFGSYRPSTVCWLKAVDPAQSIDILWSPSESFIELSSNKKFIVVKEVPEHELLKLNITEYDRRPRFLTKLDIDSVDLTHSGMYACYATESSVYGCTTADIERNSLNQGENFAYLDTIPEPGKVKPASIAN